MLVGIIGIILSIVLFVIRRFNPKENTLTNENVEEKPILNKYIQSDRALTFSKSHLLQMNATIIAGLFILMTIQGTTSAGIPALIDADLINKKIDTYKTIINNTNYNQSVWEEAEKRLAESTIDLQEYYLRLESAQRFQLAQFIFNPVSFFWISLGFFVTSSIVGLVSATTRSFHAAEGFAIAGFIWIVVGLYIYLAIPRI